MNQGNPLDCSRISNSNTGNRAHDLPRSPLLYFEKLLHGFPVDEDAWKRLQERYRLGNMGKPSRFGWHIC